MATNQNTKRKDKARVVLRKGESQRKDGKYDVRWTSPDGKRHSIYAATLEELREKENDIQRDSLEGIKAEARYVTLNDVFTLWAKVKRGLKDNTCLLYTSVPCKVGDTNGAGDTFFGAALSKLCKEELDTLTVDKLEGILAFANKAASITTSRHGAIPAMPTLAEVEG